jgi:hypothetical protein
MEYATVRDEQRCEWAVRRALEACLTECAPQHTAAKLTDA